MPTPKDKKEGIERRVLAVDDVELRLDGDDAPKLAGYIAKFGKRSEDLGGFTEKIKRGAFDNAMVECDVRCLKNHDANLILGRITNGTLRLDTNTVGLRFECDLPDTTTGRDTREEIRRKDITGCSFAFTVKADEWRNMEDGTVERTITEVDRLFDVGPVTYPAYPDTTVAARSLEHVQAKGTWAAAVPTEPEETNTTEPEPDVISAERQRKIDRGYRHAGRIIQRCKAAETR